MSGKSCLLGYNHSVQQTAISRSVKRITGFSPRLAANESRTADYILSVLSDADVSCRVEEFETSVPRYDKVRLVADGREISCRGVTFVSGEIPDASHIVPFVFGTDQDLSRPFLSYNPECDGISSAGFGTAPGLAFSRRDLSRIRDARRVQGIVEVSRETYVSRNFLVGNIKSPKTLVFTHYDCLETGACDNASGTAVCLETVIRNPELLKHTLFVIAGNEELAYDEPWYWGYGYRVFEKEYSGILEQVPEIYVVDGVGLTSPHLTQKDLIDFLPLADLKKYQDKTRAISSDDGEVIKVYHSDLDTPEKLHPDYLEEAYMMLCRSCGMS
jgi:hypothetical protein